MAPPEQVSPDTGQQSSTSQIGLSRPRRTSDASMILGLKSEIINAAASSISRDQAEQKVSALILDASQPGNPVAKTLKYSTDLKSLGISDETVILRFIEKLNRLSVRPSLRGPVNAVPDKTPEEFNSLVVEVVALIKVATNKGGPIQAVPIPRSLSLSDYVKLLRFMTEETSRHNRAARICKIQCDAIKSRVHSLRLRGVESVGADSTPRDSSS